MIATSSILKQLFKYSSVAMFSPRIPLQGGEHLTLLIGLN